MYSRNSRDEGSSRPSVPLKTNPPFFSLAHYSMPSGNSLNSDHKTVIARQSAEPAQTLTPADKTLATHLLLKAERIGTPVANDLKNTLRGELRRSIAAFIGLYVPTITIFMAAPTSGAAKLLHDLVYSIGVAYLAVSTIRRRRKIQVYPDNLLLGFIRVFSEKNLSAAVEPLATVLNNKASPYSHIRAAHLLAYIAHKTHDTETRNKALSTLVSRSRPIGLHPSLAPRCPALAAEMLDVCLKQMEDTKFQFLNRPSGTLHPEINPEKVESLAAITTRLRVWRHRELASFKVRILGLSEMIQLDFPNESQQLAKLAQKFRGR